MVNEKFLSIEGDAGLLEVAYAQQEGGKAAVICHPHPVQGGTMHNKVVTTLTKTFFELGYSTVRFNFRGVGQSAGHFAEGLGERLDLLAVISWLKQQQPIDKLLVSGFSFGAYIALCVDQEQNFDQLVLVAPPAQYSGFNQLQAPQKPWWLITAENDEVVPTPEILFWAEQQAVTPILFNIPEASHFFHGKLLLIRDFLKEHL